MTYDTENPALREPGGIPSNDDNQRKPGPAPELPVLGDIARVPGLSLPVGSANWKAIIKQLHTRAILALGFGVLYEIRKAPVKLRVDVPAFTDIGWAPLPGHVLSVELLSEVKTEAELKERWDTEKNYYIIVRLRTPESAILPTSEPVLMEEGFTEEELAAEYVPQPDADE